MTRLILASILLIQAPTSRLKVLSTIPVQTCVNFGTLSNSQIRAMKNAGTMPGCYTMSGIPTGLSDEDLAEIRAIVREELKRALADRKEIR